MSTPYNQTLAPCGTYVARRRHYRRGETCNTCGPTKPLTLAQCGTPAARKRHNRRGERCTTCTPTKTQGPIHGTNFGWKMHRSKNETPCNPCQAARDEHNTKRRTNNQPSQSTDELVEEIRFLLNAGEGTARILQATGYTGRESSLHRRLHRHGHNDLASRVLTPWDLAA